MRPLGLRYCRSEGGPKFYWTNSVAPKRAPREFKIGPRTQRNFACKVLLEIISRVIPGLSLLPLFYTA
jgi:hypothetical protein